MSFKPYIPISSCATGRQELRERKVQLVVDVKRAFARHDVTAAVVADDPAVVESTCDASRRPSSCERKLAEVRGPPCGRLPTRNRGASDRRSWF